MSTEVKIKTLQGKIEYIILKLGGEEDQDALQNKDLLQQFEETNKEIKNQLKEAHEKLKERNEMIAIK